MTENEAREWVLDRMVSDPDDEYPIDHDELMSVWTALYGRTPDEEDLRRGTCGLWTDCVLAADSQ